jgi:hypothetical protein
MQNKIPSPQIWVMVEKINEVLTSMVTQCVLNQSRGYWLLFNAIVAAINMWYMMENHNSTMIVPMHVCMWFVDVKSILMFLALSLCD